LIVIVVERATPGLRGQLTRWMLEIRVGVFVGRLSARVRDKLWALVKAKNPKGGSVMVARASNEQGFTVEAHGDTSREIVDIEGLVLVRRPAGDVGGGAPQKKRGRPRKAAPAPGDIDRSREAKSAI
jgi:CRISPR-associated protein Cas2